MFFKTIVKAIINSIQRLFDFYLWIYVSLFKRHQPVLTIKDDVLLISATDIAAKIRRRELKAVNVVEAFIRRIKDINHVLNCVIDHRFNEALKEAEVVDFLLDNDPHSPEISPEKKPILGLPFTSKEAFAIKGLLNTSGLVGLKGKRATFDAPVVARLRSAGGIALAVTNVPELCMWWETNSKLYGRTNNVYDTRRIVGGSSGGEACLISAAGSVWGVGSDIGGSIRIPCFFNGVFGHKTTRNVVPNEGQVPGDARDNAFLSTGPICRFATDLIPMLKVMAGREKADELMLDIPVDLGQLRVFSIPDDGGALITSEVSAELRQVQQRVAAFLESNGATVEVRWFEEFQDALVMWDSCLGLTGSPSFYELMGLPGEPKNPIKELFKWFCGFSDHTLPAIVLGISDYLGGLVSEKRKREYAAKTEVLEKKIITLLGKTGILLYPSNSDYAYFHNQPCYKPYNAVYTALFNVLRLPVTQVPLGLGTKGVPLGIQVVTAPGNDRLSLAVACLLEKKFGGWVPPKG